jgi:hypothetical protein
MRLENEICRRASTGRLTQVSSGARTAARAPRAGSRSPSCRNRSDSRRARGRHRRNAQNPNSKPSISCCADRAAARKDSGSNSRFSRRTFRNNFKAFDHDSVFEPIETSGSYKIFKSSLDSIVDEQLKSPKPTESCHRLLPNAGISTWISSVLFDADRSFALPASDAAVQRRDDGLCPAGHEQSSSTVLYRLAPPCGGTQVLYICIQHLVSEYAPRLGVGVLLPLAMTISPRCRCTSALATIELRIGLRLKRYACISRRGAVFAPVSQACRRRYGLI